MSDSRYETTHEDRQRQLMESLPAEQRAAVEEVAKDWDIAHGYPCEGTSASFGLLDLGGGVVNVEHPEGPATRVEADGSSWLSIGYGGLHYDGPDDLIGYYPE